MAKRPERDQSPGEAGFTLAELLIVVAIVAVLVAIAVPIFGDQLRKSEVAADLANCRSLYGDLQAFWLSDTSPNKADTMELVKRTNYDFSTVVFSGGQVEDLECGHVRAAADPAKGVEVVYYILDKQDAQYLPNGLLQTCFGADLIS